MRSNDGVPVPESRIGTIDVRDLHTVRGDDEFVIRATGKVVPQLVPVSGTNA